MKYSLPVMLGAAIVMFIKEVKPRACVIAVPYVRKLYFKFLVTNNYVCNEPEKYKLVS
jgi:hypothetical protein